MDDEIMAVIEKQRKDREKMNIFLVLAVAAVVIYTITSL